MSPLTIEIQYYEEVYAESLYGAYIALDADSGSVLPPGVQAVMTAEEHAQYWTCPRCNHCQMPGCHFHHQCLHENGTRHDYLTKDL